MQEYSVGGCKGMGELLAEANGIGQEYAALINSLSRCSNAIIAGVDGSGYFSPETCAYKQFNIKIGQKETAEVYDDRLKFVLPYAVQAWIKNEPLQLHFISPNYNTVRAEIESEQVQFSIATKTKKRIKKSIVWLKSDWAISLQINYALGEIIIPKSE
jgi:hypothetical protein